MSFNVLVANAIVDILPMLDRRGPVVEFGNQTFTVGDAGVKQLVGRLSKLNAGVDLAPLQGFDRLPRAEQRAFTQTFFKAIGFSHYAAIDVNSTYGSLMMDLNRDLKEVYGFNETFDLVTNIGTGEHIFNQFAIFKNVHRLTRVGGVMVHILPFVNWFDHGFYSFHPGLFRDVAKANQYEILQIAVGNPQGCSISLHAPQPKAKKSKAIRSPLQRLRTLFNNLMQLPAISEGRVFPELYQDVVSANSAMSQAIRTVMRTEDGGRTKLFSDVLIVAALKKRGDAEFKIPIQGMYETAIEDTSIQEQYAYLDAR